MIAGRSFFFGHNDHVCGRHLGYLVSQEVEDLGFIVTVS